MGMGEWKPIETAPKRGVFLVWMSKPILGSSVYPMNRSNITTIGQAFAFDMENKPTHWQPLPAPPTGRDET